MSRICNFEDTTTGRPCTQMVEDFHDHCEAGHPCPIVGTKPSSINAGLEASDGLSSMDTDVLQAKESRTLASNTPPEIKAFTSEELAELRKCLGSDAARVNGWTDGAVKRFFATIDAKDAEIRLLTPNTFPEVRKGPFTVECTDTFDGTTWRLGELDQDVPTSYETFDEAFAAAEADAEGKRMYLACVFGVDGKHLSCSGSH